MTLLEYRLQSGKTFQQIADETGLARATVDKVIRNNHPTSLANSIKIARALGITIVQFAEASGYQVETSDHLPAAA